MAKQQKRSNDEQLKQSESARSAAYEIRLSDAADRAYAALYEKAEQARARGESTSQHYTTLNMVDAVLEKVIPHDPFNRRYALSGKLSNMFRMQKGRLRIVWIGSSAKRIVYVLFISETLRKAGDVNDPYRLLTNMVLSGEFDALFEELGIRKPTSLPLASFRPQ